MPLRWRLCLAGILLQVCLGTAYAWSWFQRPLTEAFGWSNSVGVWPFSLAICFLGLGAAWGGLNLKRFGPAKLAMAGGALFAAGYLISAWALHLRSPWLLQLGYGVVGGLGLGLAYVTPVATVARWFPDRKGLATGLVVMGFGLGAFAMSKLFAPMLLQFWTHHGAGMGATFLGLDAPVRQEILRNVFASMGALFFCLTLPLGAVLRMPSDETKSTVGPGSNSHPAMAAGPGSPATPILSRTFALMWLIFFCNITAGIAMIGFQSPLFQDLIRIKDPSVSASAAAALGATLIGITSLFNGFGRLFWGGLSDRLGPARTFAILLAIQTVAFVTLAITASPALFAVLCSVVLLCYGGGFGTMPAWVQSVCGGERMPVAYGVMLTAWSAAGLLGPQLVALLKDHAPERAGMWTFLICGLFAALGLAASRLLKTDRRQV